MSFFQVANKLGQMLFKVSDLDGKLSHMLLGILQGHRLLLSDHGIVEREN